MKTENKKQYLKTLSENIKKVGLYNAGKVTKEEQQYSDDPTYKALKQKYGTSTAIDMMKDAETDPDFFSKLKQSEEDDIRYLVKKAQKTFLKAKSNVSKSGSEVNKTIEKNKIQQIAETAKEANEVDWQKINKLEHNKSYDENNRINC